MTARQAIVVGAGIGGLSAAVALRRAGLRVTVIERARGLEPVGAGIALAPNAVKALDRLGLADWIDRAAAIQGSGGVRRPDGRWLLRTELAALEGRFGRPLLVVPRPELVAALREQLPDDAVVLGTTVTGLEDDSAKDAAVVHTDAGEFSADLVVAADGIRSTLRAGLFPSYQGPAYSGFTAWRMIVAIPPGLSIDPSETWGKGAVFGILPLSGGRAYCYATANLPQGTKFPEEKSALAERFGSWHEPIPALIQATPPEALLRNDICYLPQPPERFHEGRVALLGDAAHAMTPNLGQGGCQAIEDALVLAHHVAGRAQNAAEPLSSALCAYTRDRHERTSRIARASARTARLQQMESGAGVLARNAAVRLVSKLRPEAMLRQMTPLASWEPPRGPRGDCP